MRGGLADHTDLLARTLAAENAVAVLTTVGAETQRDFAVRASVEDWRDARAVLAALNLAPPEGEILWQYVPHMYGRGGVNPALPRVVQSLRLRGRNQLLLAHEIAAPFSLWPQRFWYALAHRWQWHQLLPPAHFVGFSTEAWLDEWSARRPAHREMFGLVPSPSNMPRVPVPEGHAERWRLAHGLQAGTKIIAHFCTLSAAKQMPWVLQAWRQCHLAGAPVALVLIGGGEAVEVSVELKPWLKPLGHLPSVEVSAALQAADVLALPFVDGVSERRASFMAGLQHGCAVATTIGHNTGRSLGGAGFFAAAPADQPDQFAAQVSRLLADAGERRRLSLSGMAAYESRYGWPRVEEILAARLRRVRGERPRAACSS